MSALAEGVYFIRNVASQTVATANFVTSHYATLVGFKYDFGELDNQLFGVKVVGKDNKYLITHLKTGWALDLQEAETGDLVPIIVYPVNYADNQFWNINPSGSGFYKIQSVRSYDFVDLTSGLSTDNTPIVNNRDHGGASQQWEFKRVGPYIS